VTAVRTGHSPFQNPSRSRFRRCLDLNGRNVSSGPSEKQVFLEGFTQNPYQSLSAPQRVSERYFTNDLFGFSLRWTTRFYCAATMDNPDRMSCGSIGIVLTRPNVFVSTTYLSRLPASRVSQKMQ
jgi:hypothetical protein